MDGFPQRPTPDELVRWLCEHEGAHVEWWDGLGGSRQVRLNGRRTVIGNFGSLVRLPQAVVSRHLADLGLI